MVYHPSSSRSEWRPRDQTQPFSDGWTYRQLLVKCGKRGCRRCRGGPAHGPYWYAEMEVGMRIKTVYIGKRLRSVADRQAETARRAESQRAQDRRRGKGRRRS